MQAKHVVHSEFDHIRADNILSTSGPVQIAFAVLRILDIKVPLRCQLSIASTAFDVLFRLMDECLFSV